MNQYDLGATVRISNDFKVGSTLTDPTTITLKVEDPSGNEETFTYAGAQVVKAATGQFYYDYTVDEAGIWHYKWIGTGAVKAVVERQFEVKRSVF